MTFNRKIDSSPEKDNWWRFGSPLDSDLSDDEEEEVEFDPDVDECVEDDFSEDA